MAAGRAFANVFINEVVLRIMFLILGSEIVRFRRIDLKSVIVVFGHTPFISTNSPLVMRMIWPTGSWGVSGAGNYGTFIWEGLWKAFLGQMVTIPEISRLRRGEANSSRQ